MNAFIEKLRCLFCELNEKFGDEYKLSDEHIIPQVIDGWVTIPFVCNRCNNERFGSAFEAKLKKNGYIFVALEQLNIQKKGEAFRQADITIELGAGKSLSAYFDDVVGVKAFPQKSSDGSLLVPNEEAKKVLKKQVERYESKTGKKINFDLESFDKTPEGEMIQIPDTNISFIKRKGGKSPIQISGLTEPISFRLPAKIVFEHLAGLSYQLAMESEFDRIRNWILEGGENQYVIVNYPLKPENPRSLDFRPYHYIKFEYSDGCLLALIGLFSVLKFSVFLGEISYNKLSSLHKIIDYYHVYDLYNKTIFLSEGNEEMLDEEKLFSSALIASYKYKDP